MEEFRKEIAEMMCRMPGLKAEDVLPTIEAGRMGDLSCKIAFVLSKEKKENPAKIAASIVTFLKDTKSMTDNFEKVELAGPYINFYLSDKAYLSILKDIASKKEKYGSGKKKKGKIVIEFPSVNPNKPWHIGHLRNALLGDSVARMLEFEGHEVERMDYIDDLGLQVAQSLWGFLNYDSNPKGKFDMWLGQQYVGIAKRFEEDETVIDGVRDTLKKMEEGDNEIAKAGRELAEKCVSAQYQTAFDLGIYHDVLVFESDIMRTIFDEGLKHITANDAVVREEEGKNKGCMVVKLSEDFEAEFGKMENPDKVLVRSDGTAVYTGKDIIFHLWKFGKLENGFKYEPFIKQPNGKTAYKTSAAGKSMDFGKAASVINVIGVEQKYPQRVIVEILRRLKYNTEADNLSHLSYERVGLPEGGFSGRKGTWMGFSADEFIEEAKRLVLEKMKLEMDDEEKKKVALTVAVGAIKFSILRAGSDKRITFRWESALSMEGDSGPYLQYAYVRTNGILAKTKEKPEAQEVKLNPSEKALIRKMALFRDAAEKGSSERAPHHIAQYALELATEFSGFYTNSPVLTAEDENVRKTRLAITQATGIVLKNALWLLGIECPERM